MTSQLQKKPHTLFQCPIILGKVQKGYIYRMKVSEKPYIETVFPAVVQKGKTTQHIVYGRNLPGGKKTGEIINGGSIESVAVEISASMTNDDLPLDGSRPLQGFL